MLKSIEGRGESGKVWVMVNQQKIHLFTAVEKLLEIAFLAGILILQITGLSRAPGFHLTG